MPVYLSEWEQYDDGNPVGEAWRPASGPGWVGGALDLRDQTDHNLCVVEYDAPLFPLPAGVHDLSALWEESITGARANRLASFLGVNRSEVAGKTLQEIVLMLFGGSRPRKDGHAVVWCGRKKLRDERVAEPRRASIQYAETWPDDGALNVTTQDFEYVEQTPGGDDADWVVASGVCTVSPPTGATRTWNLRTLNRETDTPDAYAQGTLDLTIGTSASGRWTQGWVGCRGHETEATFYLAMVEENNGNIRGCIRKSINNSRSDLTSLAAVSLPGQFGVQADGDEISGTGLLAAHGPITDTSIDGSSGTFGYIGGFCDRDNNFMHWDDWGFGDIVNAQVIEVGTASESETAEEAVVDQDSPISPMAVHVFEGVSSRVTATDTNFVNALQVSAAELAAAGFVNGDEVIVFVWALLANAGTSETSMRVTYGGAVQTNGATPRLDFGAAGIERNIEWMGRINLGTLADLEVDIASSSTTDGFLEKGTIAVIRLSDFGVEGTDWVWDKSTTNVAHTTTYSATSRAEVTIPASGLTQDWVIFGYIHGAMDSTSVNFEARMMVDGAMVAGDFSEEAEATTEEKTWLMNWIANLNGASTHSVQIQSRDDSATAANDHRESAILAFKKSKWADIYFHAPGTVSVANASDTQVATITDTLSAAQDLLFYGEGNINLDVISTNGFMWVLWDGVAVLAPHGDPAGGLSNVRSYDATDEPNMSILGRVLNEGAGPLDYDLMAHHTGGSTESLFQTSFLIWGMAKVPTVQVVVVGTAGEVGTAQVVAAVKPISVLVGVASEIGTAQAVVGVKRAAIGTASEAGAAQAVIALKPVFVPIGAATEVGSAQVVLARKIAAIGTATEVGSAQAVVVRKSALIGAASEVETAQAVIALKPITMLVGAATEAETAQGIIALKPIFVDIDMAAEAETAQAVTVMQSLSITIGVASESETAQGIIALKPITAPVGSAGEVETAQIVIALKPIVTAVGEAGETETAQTVRPAKSALVGMASETETAQAGPVLQPIVVMIGEAAEAEVAQAVEAAKTVTVGTASEAETAQDAPDTKPIIVMVGSAAEEETAQQAAILRAVGIDPATESESAQDVGVVKPIFVAVGPATEIESARLVEALSARLVGTAGEVEIAQEVVAVKPIIEEIGTATEAESAQQINKPISITMGPASEAESAQDVGVIRFTEIGVASEADSAQDVGVTKPIIVLIGTVEESETAQGVGRPIAIAIGTAMETETGQQIIVISGVTIVSPAGELWDVVLVPPVAIDAVTHEEVTVTPGQHSEHGVTWKPSLVVKETEI